MAAFGTVTEAIEITQSNMLPQKQQLSYRNPKQMDTYSTPEQIADLGCEAATDGKDQLRKPIKQQFCG